MIKRTFSNDMNQVRYIFNRMIEGADAFEMFLSFRDMDSELRRHVDHGTFTIKKYDNVIMKPEENYTCLLSIMNELTVLFFVIPMSLKVRICELIEQGYDSEGVTIDEFESMTGKKFIRVRLELHPERVERARAVVQRIQLEDLDHEVEIQGVKHNLLLFRANGEWCSYLRETQSSEFSYAVIRMSGDLSRLASTSELDLLKYLGYSQMKREGQLIYYNNWNCEVYFDDAYGIIDDDVLTVCKESERIPFYLVSGSGVY